MFGKKTEVGAAVTSYEKVDTILGKGTEFSGKIKSAGIVRIEGKMDGELETSQDVIIVEGASINANVKARHAVISGVYNGNIVLDGKLEIRNTGQVFGDVKVAGIVIEDGGVFEGQCNMTPGDSKNQKKDKKSVGSNPT
jgi:cytoskeletal protein CcmA (bactofilin family)